MESVDNHSAFFSNNRFLISLMRFASYAIMSMNCSLMVTERSRKASQGRSFSTAGESCQSPLSSVGPLNMHCFNITASGSYSTEELGTKSSMEECETLTFWNQARELPRALGNEYVRDELARASSNEFLQAYIKLPYALYAPLDSCSRILRD